MTLTKGMLVRTTYQGAALIARVVRVKRDGTVTIAPVDPPDANEGCYMSDIRDGAAEILWALAWSAHVDEHHCANLSGVDICEVMPPIPVEAQAQADVILSRYERANGCTLDVLLSHAIDADPRCLHRSDLEERFGGCLVFMALGHGVSWFDDYKEFPLVVPRCESYIEVTCDE